MKIPRKTAGHKPRIEIIPMIDTIFFLLVFFMVATLSMTHIRGMKVELPASQTAKKEVAERVFITIDRAGSLYLDKVPLDEVRLKDLLEKRASKIDTVVINADTQVSHGRVVEVMDLVRLAGIKRIAIATKPDRQRDER